MSNFLWLENGLAKHGGKKSSLDCGLRKFDWENPFIKMVDMKIYERAYLGIEGIFFPVLHRKVRLLLKQLVNQNSSPADILDVGGRKSPYTIGMNARITLSDLPRLTDLQKRMNLGIDRDIEQWLGKRRSNIVRVIYDDMTKSQLPDQAFDVVLAVEVLEHVEHDRQFVLEARRVLKPGGSFILTTPNGDFVPNKNPDHKRHYTRDQLKRLLGEVFEQVEIEYAIKSGFFRKMGGTGFPTRRPWMIPRIMLGTIVNRYQSRGRRLADRKDQTEELLAVAKVGKLSPCQPLKTADVNLL
jgi:SAM-dependent methyltransferase